MSQPALSELLRGKGAHADPIACVEDISWEVAARQVAEFPHSIGQLVFHMNFWMNYDLLRVRGDRPPYPEHNAGSFPPPGTPKDAEQWDRLRRDFAGFLAEHTRLAGAARTELERSVAPISERHTEVAGTVEAILWQTVAHNSYHVGQIALLRRAIGQWPPKAGGDTW
jgi:DinB superfamily